MATKPEFIDYLLDQLNQAGVISARKMFGEYGLYCDEKIVALVCDDQLFIKPTGISEHYLDASHYGKPYPGAKDYFQVPEEKLEDADWLSQFVRDTADQLPFPKPKTPKIRKPAANN